MKTLNRWLLISILAFFAWTPGVFAEGKPSRGQVLYVPVYSEIPYGDRGYTVNLTATLSVRNLDLKNSVTLKRVEYFNSRGERVRAYLGESVTLRPLASMEYIVKESDRSGGISASFIVEWNSETPVLPPVVEALMIGTQSNQGISFSTTARVIEESQ